MTNKKEPTYAEIWDTLSKVDVSEYVEEKMNLSYLSWSRAWWLLMEHYPEATYEYHEGRKFADGTVEVSVTIHIGGWLPCQLWITKTKLSFRLMQGRSMTTNKDVLSKL